MHSNAQSNFKCIYLENSLKPVMGQRKQYCGKMNHLNWNNFLGGAKTDKRIFTKTSISLKQKVYVWGLGMDGGWKMRMLKWRRRTDRSRSTSTMDRRHQKSGIGCSALRPWDIGKDWGRPISSSGCRGLSDNDECLGHLQTQLPRELFKTSDGSKKAILRKNESSHSGLQGLSSMNCWTDRQRHENPHVSLRYVFYVTYLGDTYLMI